MIDYLSLEMFPDNLTVKCLIKKSTMLPMNDLVWLKKN